jgi:ribosomal protein S18 acetylase RimI-like enzyme
MSGQTERTLFPATFADGNPLKPMIKVMMRDLSRPNGQGDGGSMTDDYSIREYRAGDFVAIDELWQTIGLGGRQRGDDEKVVEATIRAGGSLLVLTEEPSGRIIGTSWITHDSRRAYLHHFGIAKSCQGRGLSGLLMDASFRVLKKLGYQVKLEVHRGNTVAIDLYRKNGFEYLGDYDVYIIRDLAAVMEKLGRRISPSRLK